MELNLGEALKSNNNELVVGFDLTDSYSQISYGYTDREDVDTLSTVAGENSFLIPTALFKRREVNQWFAGKDAVKNKDADGFYLDKLLEKAVSGSEIMVGEESFSSAGIIALFMKRAISSVSLSIPVNRISSFMITVDKLDSEMVKVLSEAVSLLGLKTKNIFFQSHTESFYYYAIYSPRELWQREVLLVDFSTDYVKTYRMECNKNTTPIVAFIDTLEFPEIPTTNIKNIEAESTEAKKLDTDLFEKLKDRFDNKLFSSIYFIGDNFRQDIFQETLKYICHHGRVFEGNNLFSKGAAYSAKNKLGGSILSLNHVFLGNDKLKSNVGINVLNRGKDMYLPLLDAGVNWFEAQKEIEVILNEDNVLSFVITPLTGKNPKVVDITLSELPKRPPKTSRIKIHVSMISEKEIKVDVTDLGFGNLYASGNIEWNEVIEL